VAEQISSTEEIPDRRARRPVRETPDKNKSARCLSDRFHSIRRALDNCKKCGICSLRPNGRSALARQLFLLSTTSYQPPNLLGHDLDLLIDHLAGETVDRHDEIALRLICGNRRQPLPAYSRVC
jgi:hypothetical protein